MSRSPFATTSTVAASWPSSTNDFAPTTTTPEPALVVEEELTTTERPDLPDEIALPGPAETVTSQPEDVPSETIEVTTTAEPVSAWASSFNAPSTTDTGSAWYEATPSLDRSYATDDSIASPDPAADVEETASSALQANDDPLADTNAGAVDSDDAPSTEQRDDPFDLSSWYTSPTPLQSSAQSVQSADAEPDDAPVFATAPASRFDSTTDSDPFSRAQSLVDELRDLLPQLGGGNTGDGTKLDDVATVLTAVCEEVDVHNDEMSRLMSVVEMVRDQPRNIDGMLDLARQVDAIVTLKADLDRYRAAIDDALGYLPSK